MIRGIRGLTLKRVALLTEAGVCVAIAKVLVHGVPFRWTARTMGTKSMITPEHEDGRTAANAKEIRWALQAIARRVRPLRQCLPQAMAAQWMTRRRGIRSTLYLGTRREAGVMEAHAWLRAGTRTVVGGEVCGQYSVIAAFGTPE